MTLIPVGLSIKLPENIKEKLIKEKEAKNLRYSSKAPIKKEYVLFLKELAKDMGEIRNYMKISISYVT
jgi:hypothetical protein